MIGNHLEPFKFWCQKVLPNVYDDSLSYYEYLCKLNEYLNEVIGQINTLTDNMEDYESDLSTQWTAYKNALNAEWAETKNYIDNYFNNLDVQQEINNKLDQMAQSGALSTLLAPIVGTQIGGVVAQQIGGTVANQIDNVVAQQINGSVAGQIGGVAPDIINSWLTENVDPVGSAVVVDDTLTISGAAADSAVVGYNVNNINNVISALHTKIQFLDSSLWESLSYWHGPNDLRTTSDTGYASYPKITLPAGTYKYARMNFDFCWAKPVNGASYKPFNSASGTFVLSVKTDLYLTCQYPTSDYTMCMIANGDLPSSYVLGVYDTSIPTLYDKTDKSVTDEILNEISVIHNYEQFFNNTLWEQNKYYAGANNKQTTSDSGYAAYPPLILPAGTYYYKNLNTSFSFAKGSGSSYQPFNTTTGSVTFNETTTLWCTCAYPITDYTKCMISNGELPSSYSLGIYKTDIPTLDEKGIRGYILVDVNGNGDFTNIQDALDSANDSSTHRVVIVVLPGTYEKFTTKKNNSMVRRYIDIIGFDRNNTIVKTDTGDYYNPPANILLSGTIKNMSFISTNDNFVGSDVNYSYAVHMDFNPGANTRYENCYFYSENGPAIGIGMYDNETLEFLNCEFIHNTVDAHGTSALGAFYLHARGEASARNQLLKMQNCICHNKTGTHGICLHELVTGSEQSFNIVNTIAYGNNGASAQVTGTWDKGYSFGNNATVLNA